MRAPERSAVRTLASVGYCPLGGPSSGLRPAPNGTELLEPSSGGTGGTTRGPVTKRTQQQRAEGLAWPGGGITRSWILDLRIWILDRCECSRLLKTPVTPSSWFPRSAHPSVLTIDMTAPLGLAAPDSRLQRVPARAEVREAVEPWGQRLT